MSIGNVTSRLRMTAAGAFALAFGVCAPALAQDTASDTSVQSDTPWYESFSLNQDAGLPLALEEIPTIDWSVNDRLGITLGIREDLGRPTDVDDFSAGVTYDLNGRIRFGGQFRFTTPTDELFMMDETDEPEPEIKFESSVRF